MTERDLDYRVRVAAFAFLDEKTRLFGDVLPREVLAQGFIYDGQRVPLIGPQGIFKPKVLPEIPLSITTVPAVEGRARPYEDEFTKEGLLLYRYRGTDPMHRDNVGLRFAMERETPLVYLYGIVPGRYMAEWPVYIVRDDPPGLSFTVAVDDRRLMVERGFDISEEGDMATDIRRMYVTRQTRQRMHQQGFRERVLRAYRQQCAICRLRHEELLDAAHILPDTNPRGAPVVPNGLALCKLHHAAFDRYVLGIRPDLTVELRLDVLTEADGPMLRHGLQGFQGTPILVPRRASLQPKREFIEERYEIFRKAM